MAIFKGVNAAKRDASPSEKVISTDLHGRLRVSYDEFDAAGPLAANDTIQLMKVPPGSRIHDIVIASTDLGTTGLVDIGWEDNGVEAANLAGFMAAVDVNAAATVKCMTNVATPTPGLFIKFTNETQITAKMNAASTVAGKIRVAVHYSLD